VNPPDDARPVYSVPGDRYVDESQVGVSCGTSDFISAIRPIEFWVKASEMQRSLAAECPLDDATDNVEGLNRYPALEKITTDLAGAPEAVLAAPRALAPPSQLGSRKALLAGCGGDRYENQYLS
jgi:hypothetical protein